MIPLDVFAFIHNSSVAINMIGVKLDVTGSLRHMLSEDPVIDITLNRSDWSNDDELKKHLMDILIQRWSSKQNKSNPKELILPPLRTYMLAINDYFVNPNTPLTIASNDSISIIQQVAGG